MFDLLNDAVAGAVAACHHHEQALRVRNLFRDVQELTNYCQRNPDFPQSLGMETPIECWEFNPRIPLHSA